MIVLGIESSCDETGVALVEAGPAGLPRLRGQALHSQIRMHQAYGGVVPELASRDHVRRVLPLLEVALGEAGLGRRDVDVVAFTRGPLVYATGLVDGFKRGETVRFAGSPAVFAEGDTLRIEPEGRAPIVFEPYFQVGGRRDSAWRLTWLGLADDGAKERT